MRRLKFLSLYNVFIFIMEIRKNSVRAWLLATRPKTLAGAAVPVFIGSASAYNYGEFNIQVALLCLVFAFLMQVDANFINDLFDFLKGSDTEERLGPQRACAQGWIGRKAMTAGIAVTTLVAICTGLGLLVYAGPELIVIGALCVVFAFLYTAGPYPLAYHGWGDVLVLVFFGFIPVGTTFYIMTHALTMEVLMASLACGLVIDTLLLVNNYRDRDQDAAAGKRTLVVRWGAEAGLFMYVAAGVLACVCCLYFWGRGDVYAAILPQFYLIPHIITALKMKKIGRGRELNVILGRTSMNMLLFGILLSIGLLF